jgi:hypothetical protein
MAAMQAPGRSMLPPTDPVFEGGFVGPVLQAALAAWTRHVGVVLAVVLAVAAIDLPVQWMQGSASERAQSVADRQRNAGEGQIDPEEAARELEAAGPACCMACGSTLYGLFILLPAVAGGTVAGARAVRGNVRFSDVGAGFRRYGATLVTAVATALIGGGAAVAVAVMSTLSMLGSASRALGGLVSSGVLTLIVVGFLVITLWLTARLWFALTRVADPDRPAISGVLAVTQSWQWTAGAVGWRVFAVLLIASGLSFACMVPSALLAQGVPADTGWTLRTALATLFLAIGGIASFTIFILLLGAAYERVVGAREPIAPPVHPEAATASGGLDA